MVVVVPHDDTVRCEDMGVEPGFRCIVGGRYPWPMRRVNSRGTGVYGSGRGFDFDSTGPVRARYPTGVLAR
jgi:hypothetical protein